MPEFTLSKMCEQGALLKVCNAVRGLDSSKAWVIKIEEKKPKRSENQNRLLWRIYSEIIEKGGEAMAGWRKEDLHTFFLIEHFGSETTEIFGKKRNVPLRRSSKLSKMEFVDFVDHILQFMAEKGVFIEMPGDL